MYWKVPNYLKKYVRIQDMLRNIFRPCDCGEELKNSWIEILNSIQSQTEKVLKKWQRDVSDCDDFALVTASAVAASFAHDPFEKQVAFAITWSRSHAYNSFITTEGTWEIYEPQSNAIVGRLGKTTGIYKTEKIWFMG